jgi:hypothetical protein
MTPRCPNFKEKETMLIKLRSMSTPTFILRFQKNKGDGLFYLDDDPVFYNQESILNEVGTITFKKLNNKESTLKKGSSFHLDGDDIDTPQKKNTKSVFIFEEITKKEHQEEGKGEIQHNDNGV